jgi:hypothetical protein
MEDTHKIKIKLKKINNDLSLLNNKLTTLLC